MKTLLPKSEIRHLKHEYRLRCLILMLFLLSGAVWVGIIALFPSYIISVTEEHGVQAEADKINSTSQANGGAQISAEVKDANSLIQSIASSQDTLFFSSLIEDIDEKRVPGMIITDFSFSHTPGGPPNQSTISITGNAATRPILLAFEQNLKNDPRLSQIELPVSDLAEDANINFTMSITGIQ